MPFYKCETELGLGNVFLNGRMAMKTGSPWEKGKKGVIHNYVGLR